MLNIADGGPISGTEAPAGPREVGAITLDSGAMQAGHLHELRELLADTPFASAAADESLLRAFDRRAVSDGQTFVMQGDAGDTLAIVASGIVRGTRRVSDDRDLTVFLMRRGDVYGFLPLLDGGPCPLSLAADSDAVVYLLHCSAFKNYLEHNPRFATQLLGYVAGRLRECIDQLGMLGKPGALSRLAAAIAGQLAADAAAGTVIEWPMRQRDLADALGVAPENLSRAVTRLQQMGVIRRVAGHRVRVEDPAKLRALAERAVGGE